MSGEQTVEVGRGIRLCYEALGDPSDPPLLLVMGLGQQMLAWSDEFCALLVEKGFQVVRFDNRDIGRSTKSHAPVPRFPQYLTRRFDPEQYALRDMAEDTAGLLDALELSPAHVVGISMGGMIGQTLAAHYPDHVRSLVSIMSTTGARNAGWVAPTTLRLMFGQPVPRDRDQAADRSITIFNQIRSAGFAFDEDFIRERARRAFDRDPRAAAGTARQMAAITKSGNRTGELAGIAAPTLVLHGDRDLMVHPSGGRATAAAIPNARHETIAGLGHDLPTGAWQKIVELIADHAHAADRAGAGQPDRAAAQGATG